MSGRRIKSLLLIAGIASSGLTLIAWTQTWFDVRLVEGELATSVLSVGGEIAAGALAALGLAGLALVGALSIAGPVFRAVLGVVQVVLGATVALGSVLALLDPVGASSAAVTTATGISGDESTAALVVAVQSTPWPWIATILGISTALLGVVVLLTSRRWPGSSRKYQSVRFESADESPTETPDESDSVTDWDALSDGSDPTSR